MERERERERGSNMILASDTMGTYFWPAFEAMDMDCDRKISRDDLRRLFYSGFSSREVEEEEEAIEAMILVADVDKKGFVEYDEFELVLGGRRSSGGEVMEGVFKVMDRDGDGKLSHEDLKSCLESAGFSVGEEDINAMILLGGDDQVEGVSLDGFIKIFSG